ncbi:MAG TPA: putative metalloprotease CJM1_0395 family protein [Bryobacterales bacterium]|nr:putative metalloprotease CJM1_0395 family protein [Bryobacterales bacterium]
MMQTVSPNLVSAFMFTPQPLQTAPAENIPAVTGQAASSPFRNDTGPPGAASGQVAGRAANSSSNPAGSTQGDQVSFSAGLNLTAAQQVELAQLAEIDRHVHAHELAHLAAAGSYARGGPSYSYATGPDGKLYAVGGEVSIDTSPVPNDPAATVAKMAVVEAAANAPSDPSPQDRQVAAAAVQTELSARLEVAAQRAEQAKQAAAASADPRIAAYTKPQQAESSQFLQLVA